MWNAPLCAQNIDDEMRYLMLTEKRNPLTTNIDHRSTLEILEVMNGEDASVAATVRSALPAIAEAVDMIVAHINSGGRLIYVGAGTSGRLGVLDAAECVPTFSVDPELVQAIIAGGRDALITGIEGAEDSREGGRNDLLARNVSAKDAVVGIAASGRTPYVVAALETANEIGAGTVGIACSVPAPVLDAATIKIPALVGPEVITGSTRLKAGTAQKLILNMISTATMIRLGKVYGNLMVDVKVSNQKLAERARRIVCEVTNLREDEAALLLENSNNEVKTAIVMALLGVTADEARARLTKEQGFLGRVIGR
jgi:N-acetylmuramic acid 6-phosphate etherase